MREKALSMVLTVLLVIGILPAPAHAAAVNGVTPEMAQAYLEVLNNCIATYGTTTATDSTQATSTGLAHSSLVDFEGDGVPELYMLYATQPMNEAENVMATLTEEIWKYSGSGASCIYKEVYTTLYTFQRNAEDTYVRLLPADGKTVRVTYTELSAGSLRYGYSIDLEVLRLNGSEMTDVVTVVENIAPDENFKGEFYTLYVNGAQAAQIEVESCDDYFECIKNTRSSETQAYYNKYPVWDQNAVIHFDMWSRKITWQSGSVLAELQAAAQGSADTDELKARLPYTGDISKMNMSAAQAAAFAKVLRSYTDNVVSAAPFDGGNGIPILWVATGAELRPEYDNKCPLDESCFFEWTGEDVQENSIFEHFLYYYTDVRYVPANRAITASVGGMMGAFTMNYSCALQNGRIEQPDWSLRYYELGYPEPQDNPVVEDFFLREFGMKIDTSHITNKDWVCYEVNGTYTLYLENGAPRTEAEYEASHQKTFDIINDERNTLGIEYAWAGRSTITGNWQDGGYTASLLESYAAAERTVLARERFAPSNISVDYKKTAGFTKASDYVDYLYELLQSTDNEKPNDAAKSELVIYIENAVSTLSTEQVKCRNNTLLVKGRDVESSVNTALQAQAELLAAAREKNVELNKDVSIVIRALGAKMDAQKPMKVTLDPSLADALHGASLQILLGDGKHMLRVDASDVKELSNQYGKLTVSLSRDADGKYSVSFIDGDGNTLQRIEKPVTISLPCESPFSTVLASYADGSDNWGGQYDSANGTISFETVYSGVYETIDNAQEISDISALSQEQIDAIRFMVSKGYFALDEGGAFYPDALLTRYDFTAALVGMFFALDRELKSDFPDVPQDSPYYAQVASAEAGEIVKGFDDGTFGGDKNITVEQVLALAARTLADKKGYAYPENPEDYLIFPGAEEVSEWARETTALAAREGIADAAEAISPAEGISRADAALYLYRLFMLLYEVSPVEISTSAAQRALSPTAAVCVSVVLLAAAAALALYWRRRQNADTAVVLANAAAEISEAANEQEQSAENMQEQEEAKAAEEQ